jgi:ribosomal protein L24E
MAFKSSDVNQPSTNYAEADTFGFVSKTAGDTGGLKFGAFTESGVDSRTCYYYVVNADNADTTKSASGEGLYQVDLAINSGTGSNVVNADGNMVAFTSNGNARFLFDAEGSGHADVEWTTFSDARLKTDVAASPYGLASVRSLEAKIFDKWSGMIDDSGAVVLEEYSDRRMLGFIAQDIKAAIPELVRDLPDNKSFYSLDYGRMTPVLWSAVQELDAEVQTLRARVTALEG